MRKAFSMAAAVVGVTLAGGAVAGTADDLIAKNKCSRCHTAKTTKKAPSFASIAEQYKGQADASAKLVAMLKTGGTTDHDKLVASDADLSAVVAFVLSQR